MISAIEIRNINKVFSISGSLTDLIFFRRRETTALNDVSFDIKEGEIFGLLGPNGAGKTTLIKILSTLISPTRGTARIYGYDVIKNERKVKKFIGLIHSDERSFFWRLTGRQNLEFFASLFNIPKREAKKRIDKLFGLIGMEQQADSRFHYYSTGMKQKLAIARGLLTHPKILFMDEALRSIDPVATYNIRKFIKHEILDILGGTIIIATHRLDEAAELCNRIAILDKGHLVACGSKEDLSTMYRRSLEYDLEITEASNTLIDRIRQMTSIRHCIPKEHVNGKFSITISLNREETDLHMVLQEIIKHQGHIQKCSRIEPSLESVFYDVLRSSEISRAGDLDI
jgi:ABC-2 type transport system ATP-binding protein